MERKLGDYLELKDTLTSKLQEHGISLEQIQDILPELEVYVSDCENLDQLRRMQFSDAARTLGIEISAATQKNVEKISVFLRIFARHVATSVLEMDAHLPLEEMLDHIPDMEESE